MQVSSMISLPSRSFNRYSNSEVAEIAARVVEEFGSEEYFDEFYFESDEEAAAGRSDDEGEGRSDCGGESDTGEDDESEFAFVTRSSGLSSPISADEIFQNGQIRPVYPVLSRGLFLEHAQFGDVDGKVSGERIPDCDQVPSVRLPLKKLFTEEMKTTTMTSSSSSSESDELEGVPAESYCIWRPKEEVTAAEVRCKTSSSSGSSNSKRWNLKNLLPRSHSDGGKDNFIFLSPSNSGRKKLQDEERARTAPASAEKAKPAAAPTRQPLYSRDGGEKRRSYLPYRQDLMGIFSNVNGLSKNLQPF